MEKSIFKDVLVGLFEFDFSYIYNMENRTMRHQWVGLNNPDGEDFSEVAAFMKLSASIHGPGDKPEELKEDPEGVLVVEPPDVVSDDEDSVEDGTDDEVECNEYEYFDTESVGNCVSPLPPG